jgi:putative transposase
MLKGAEILFGLVADTFRWLRLSLRSSRSIKAENLFLRRQLALYIERGVNPRRIDLVTRIGLTLLSRSFNWRDALVVVRFPLRARDRHDPPGMSGPADPAV